MTVNKTTMFRYQGRSMWPCFQKGDLLEYKPCSMADVRVGDCIVYKAKTDRHITHRVIAKGKTLITRGDAFHCADKDPVHANQFIGKVICRHRIGQVSTVTGGIKGQIAALFYRYAGRIDPHRNARGGKLARRLQSISMIVFKPLWNKGQKKKLIMGNKEEVTLWVLGKATIGRKYNHNQKWEVPWPWALVIQISED